MGIVDQEWLDEIKRSPAFRRGQASAVLATQDQEWTLPTEFSGIAHSDNPYSYTNHPACLRCGKED